MRQLSIGSAIFILLATFFALAGCSFVSVHSRQYLAVPGLSPNGSGRCPDPSLRAGLCPHERLGEVSLKPEGNPPIAEMEAKLKQAAAKMGANAVVIVADTTGLWVVRESMVGPSDIPQTDHHRRCHQVCRIERVGRKAQEEDAVDQ